MAWISHTDASNESNGTINNDVIDYNLLHLTNGVCGLVLFSVTLVILLFMICLYKTYKTTLQRLIVYYILLSMWFAFSIAVGALPGTERRRWNCIVDQYLLLSSQMAWYTYIASITSFALILIPCLMRGKHMPHRMRKCVECICILLAVAMGLTVASVMKVDNHAHGIIGCVKLPDSLYQYLAKRNVIIMSIYLGMDLEVILVSLSLCVAFFIIRRRVHIKQMAVLLRNSICHVAINASIMGLDILRVGFFIYKRCTLKLNETSGFLETTGVVLWDAFFFLVIFVSIIFQAILCIQTSTERKSCNCCKGCCHVNMNSTNQHYTAIDGKDTPTNPVSSRISQPSYTNFEIPYTGGFPKLVQALTVVLVEDASRDH